MSAFEHRSKKKQGGVMPLKEHNVLPMDSKEMEIDKVPDKEFRRMAVRMLKRYTSIQTDN